MTPEEELALKNALWDATNIFRDLRTARHTLGERKYGSMTFMENDVFRMLLEELADVANYVDYLAAKLILLQQYLEADPRLQQHIQQGNITIGLQSFKGTKEGW